MRNDEERERRKAKRRATIVMVAAELFLQHGVPEVSMTQIAEACDLGVATLYRYFGTKAGILVEAGALIWADLRELFEGEFEGEGYNQKSGMEQIELLLAFVPQMYLEHKPFLRFLHDFDNFVLSEHLQPERLAVYESNMLTLYPPFAQAYEKACAEGTARKGLDIPLLYDAVSHALICTCQKFMQGNIVAADADMDKLAELNQLVDLTMHYIRA